jgi:hypothetical protein
VKHLREFIKILMLCIGAAIAYGVIHDQITARICVEYFTVAHPPVFSTDSPTLLGLGWGVIATWWVGAFLGVLLAIAALTGKWPILPASRLKHPVGRLLMGVAAVAVVSGLTGYLLTKLGVVGIGGWETAIPRSKHNAFAADMWAHSASYLAGFVGGVGLVVRTLRHRWRHSQRSNQSNVREPMPPSR